MREVSAPSSGQTRRQFSLFNAADDCLATNIGIGSFEESLLLNILFQHQLLVNEAYFFNSTLLASHLERAIGRPSLFEAACREGLICPAFRDPNTTSLDQAYDRMRSEDVYGKEYSLLHPQVQPLRDRIVGSVNVGLEKIEPFIWPNDERGFLGEGYRQVIGRLLQTDDPPEYVLHDDDRQQLLQRVWAISKPWRFDCVEDAIQRTEKKGAYGLQRTELFRTVGWSLGIPPSIYTIGVPDIIERCTDEEQRMGMTIFLKWVTQCHHVNQAQYFGTAINFPVYDLDQDFIVDTLLRSPLDPEPPSSEGFRCRVKLPPVDALLQADPTELLRIRADLGLGYLTALRRWERDSSTNNEESVRASLSDYCNRICQHYELGTRQQVTATYVKGALPQWSHAVQAIGTAGSVTAGVLGAPVIGVFCQCTALMTGAIYRYLTRRHIHSRLNPKSRELEVTLPSSW